MRFMLTLLVTGRCSGNTHRVTHNASDFLEDLDEMFPPSTVMCVEYRILSCYLLLTLYIRVIAMIAHNYDLFMLHFLLPAFNASELLDM